MIYYGLVVIIEDITIYFRADLPEITTTAQRSACRSLLSDHMPASL